MFTKNESAMESSSWSLIFHSDRDYKEAGSSLVTARKCFLYYNK